MRFVDCKTFSQASGRACRVWAEPQLLPVSWGGGVGGEAGQVHSVC